jgi:acetyl esterase/lipase
MKKLLIAFAFFASLHAVAQDTAFAPVDLPAGFTKQIDVLHTQIKGWDGRMDIYMPPNTGMLTPVVINIHGGGWNKGQKESQRGFNTFFKAGYAVANVAYRLTGHTPAPAAVEDVRCALVYLINNAQSLNIDVNKIVVMGGSAGGHLALMAGMLGNDKRFDTNCKTDKEIKVAAIVDKYGITDVWDWGYGPIKTSKSATSWLGNRANDKKFAASVSPITYVNKNTPPVYIVHGDADPTVPYQQSENLYKKLQEAGVKSKFVTVEGGLHGKFDKEKNSEINKDIIEFLKSVGI